MASEYSVQYHNCAGWFIDSTDNLLREAAARLRKMDGMRAIIDKMRGDRNTASTKTADADREFHRTVNNLFCEYADCKIIDKENAK